MGSKEEKNAELLFLHEEEYENELKTCDKILKLDPSDFKAWMDRGYALLQLGKFEEALESYNKAIEIKPKDTTAWYNKGAALSNLGRFEEAAEVYTNLLEITPNDAGTLMELSN